MKSIGRKTRQLLQTTGRLSSRYPFRTFLFTLLVIFTLIVIGNRLRKPTVEEEVKQPPKQVKTYALGGVPIVRAQGQVEKSGVISIVAQAPGIVSAIRVTEGQTVAARSQLFSLSTNYQGGNSAGVARQIAQSQHKNVTESYTISKELIDKQRELAEKSRDNTNELRTITERSLDETRSLLSLNDTIISSINSNLQTLEQNNTGGTNDALILSTQQLKSQFQGATNQLRSGLRQAEYQVDEKKPPQDIANLQKDVAVKQLELQEKGLNLSREVSGLQLRLAQVNEAIMYPAAPFAGKIESIHVRVGQTVNPGTPLATLAGTGGEIRVVARLPKDIASRISTVEKSTITLPNKQLQATPTFVAGEATDGNLVRVTYDLLPADAITLTDTEYIAIDLPVGNIATPQFANGRASVFIPLESVFQTQQASQVYILDNGRARSRTITLGSVLGDMVEVIKGLSPTDEVILNRTVLDGEQVVRTTDPEQKKEKRELGMK